MSALDELTVAYAEARADPVFQAELTALLRGYAGRPTLLTEVPRFAAAGGRLPGLPQARGPGPHRLAQDQQRARPGAADQAPGQDPGHRRDRRRPARRGHRDRGRAARPGVHVYMGEEDTRRQALNVARMRMLGAEVVPVTTGSRTLKDAMNEAMRNWVTTVDGHPLLHRLGRRATPLPDDGARLPARHRRRGARADARRDRPAAGRGDRLRRRRLERHRHLPRLHPGRRASR